MNLSNLEKKLKIKFNNVDLLQQAMIHRSYLNENPDFYLEHNERLEFLGDAVLEMVVTENLYCKYPNPEGDLTSWRAALVNASMLSDVAKKLDIDNYLLLSKGEKKDTGRARKFILADALEALIGAIYLDQGYETSSKFIEKNILKELPKILNQKLYRDSKSCFQEKSQEHLGITPNYKVIKESGPDHEKHFIVGAYIGKDLIAEGEGVSKQNAQMDAAKNALKKKGWN
ncbi:ribonuclease III [Patescibacteria group bacterium]